jgi:Restriction endonuclease
MRAFQIEGAEVRWPYSVDLGGEEIEQIDGAVYSDGLSCIIECKDQTERASIEPIAKLRNQLLRRPGAAVGLVFSKSGFTEPAVTLARFVAPQTILLWYGAEINFALATSQMRLSLTAKYRHCIEAGFPDFNVLSKELP